MSEFTGSGDTSGSGDEPTPEDVQKYMTQMQQSSQAQEVQAWMVDESTNTKYTGPLAIREYRGPKVQDPETGNMCMHGEGSIEFADGSSYEGGFQLDHMHGKGTFKDTQGNVYIGEWYEDQRHGQAKFTTIDGSVFEGTYVSNKRHGKGIDEDAAGNRFEGTFADGDPVEGTMDYAEGDVYKGEFAKDWSRHGKGKYISIDTGAVQDGIWVDDVFTGPV